MVERITFVVPTEIAIGYELAGAEVYREDNPQQAAKLITQLVQDSNIGLIIIPDHFYNALDPFFLKRLETKTKPVLIQIPYIRRITETIKPQTYVQEAIKRATGYYLKIDLEGNK